MDEYILLEANDCCAFKKQAKNEHKDTIHEHSNAIQFFISNAANWNVFHFATEVNKTESVEIAYFNYQDAKWYAGRLVGEATFNYENKKYKIRINPRFGSLHLFRMLEEVFNVRFSNSTTLLSKQDESQYLIKRLISFLWLNLLAKANKHGLPRHNIKKEHRGCNIRGRLNVRQSIKPLYIEKKLVSNYREKYLDDTVTQILKQAHSILLSKYDLGTFSISPNARDAITQLSSTGFPDKHINENDFRRLVYKDIYLSFKPVVDLSWDIIKRKSIGSEQSKKMKDSTSFFIDVAEIWELYLKSLLKKHLSKYGWNLINENLKTYEQKDFQRTLIPDIVFQCDKKIIVLDAKYKRMLFDYRDYDRADFFQIHTYINYYNQNTDVVVGGLLYPLSIQFNEQRQEKNISNTLFSADSTPTKFLVDGIDLSFIGCGNFKDCKNGDEKLFKNQLEEMEKQFVARIKNIAMENSNV